VAVLPHRGRSRDQAAQWAGVSARTIQNAATVKSADPALFEQIKTGKVKADQAARRVHQRQRDAQLPAAPTVPKGVFDLIYADPPWRLPGSPDSSRAIENHYPTMPLEEICGLKLPAAEDALLYLWSVPTMPAAGLQVMEAWGFEYVDQAVWVKNKFGQGQYVRHQHELLLIGRRGMFPPPPTDRRFASVISAPRGRNSAKPECVYELLERAHPRSRKLELFARCSRPGWSAWGNQAPGAAR
jgi:N6-adenosine-specific RNA methylase IME4